MRVHSVAIDLRPAPRATGGLQRAVLAQASALFKQKSTILQASVGARQKLAFPCQRVAHDGFQIVKMRLPFEHSAGELGSRHEPCWISQPPGSGFDFEVDAGSAFVCLDYGEHRETPAVTAVERDGGAARAQI